MKKIILKVLSLTILIISTLTINSFSAITSANFTLSTSKETYNVGDEIIVTFRLDSLTADRGIIAYSAQLEYDKEKLSYVSCSGIGNWTTPFFNENNGKLISDRNNDYSSLSGEDLCTIKFKAEKQADNVNVKISNIELSNGGNAPGKSNDVQVSFNIRNSNPSNPDDDNNDNDDNNNSDNNDSDNNHNNNINSNNDKNNSNNNNNNNSNNNNNNNNSNNNDNNINHNNNNSANSINNNNVSNVTINIKSNNKNTTSSKNNTVNNNTTSSSANNKIPSLGTNVYLTTLIGIAFILTIILFARIKLLDRKIKRESKNLLEEDIKKDNK